MTIKAERYTKNGETTTLEFGMSSSGSLTQYYVKLDTVVVSQSALYRPVWESGVNARAMLNATGWRKV